MPPTRFLFLAAALLASASDSSAQQPEPADDGRFPGLLGGAFTTRFDNSFNPALAVVFDGLAVASDSDDPELNDARMRVLELDLAGRFDPLGWGYAVIAFADDGVDEEVELEEAAIWLDDGLPGDFSLRGGKFLADFGKWNTIHQHDRAFMFTPAPSEEFFGGEMGVSGLELHHWFGAGELPVRWSLGVAPRFGGHAHAHAAGGGLETEFSSEALDRRTPSQFLYTGRLSAQHDAGVAGFFQWGVSAAHTPAGLAAPADLDSDELPDVEFEAAQTTLALDLSLRLPDPAGRTAHTAGIEVYANEREAWDPVAAALAGREANGAWGFYEYAFSPSWSAGAVASWHQEAAAIGGRDWFIGAESASSRALFASWNLSHFNRLRLQVGQEAPAGAETSWTVALQWTAILGNHQHPLDW